jgi:hypothetical protein
MFNNRIVKANTSDIFEGIRKIKLIDANLKIKNWDTYLQEEIKYGKDVERINFIEETKVKFEKYLEANSKWKFRFQKDVVIELINYGKKEVILSKDWTGEIAFQNDLVLELYEEKTFPLGRHICYFSNAFVRIQIYIEKGGPDNVMSGARPGTHDMWRKIGTNEKIILDKNNNQIMIGEALFQIEN